MEWINNIGASKYILISLGISAIGLSFVYLLGRMLGILEYWRYKNYIAFGSITFFTIFYNFSYPFKRGEYENIYQFFYMGFVYWAISIILYTIIGMRLFERSDSFLDKKFGADKDLKYKKRGKKK